MRYYRHKYITKEKSTNDYQDEGPLHQPPLKGGMRATVSPSFNFNTSPMGTYSSFNAKVIFSSSRTNDASFGYSAANVAL